MNKVRDYDLMEIQHHKLNNTQHQEPWSASKTMRNQGFS